MVIVQLALPFEQFIVFTFILRLAP
jgi:hypothetical protein